MPSPLFFDTVPIAELAERGLKPELASADAPKTVLVVDDEHVLADTLALILTSRGYRARVAYTGESALKQAGTTPPDILITDVMMPGMSGVELAIITRNNYPECRIILFSGNAATQDLVENARQRGYKFEFLSKPVHPDTLLQRLAGHGLKEEVA